MKNNKSTRTITSEEVAASRVIANAIKRSRKSQEEIGNEVGVSQGQIWQWANARRGVSPARAVALAHALNIQDPSEISPKWAAAFDGSRAHSNNPPHAPQSRSDIAGTLNLLMARHELSDNALSRLTDVPQPTISRIRNGERRNPRSHTIEPIADYFNVTLAQLRGEEPLREESHTNEQSATTELYSLTHKASPKSKRVIARLVDADLQGELDAADYEFIERLIERLRGKNNA